MGWSPIPATTPMPGLRGTVAERLESSHAQAQAPSMISEASPPGHGDIVVVGPILPFRGGISQYNELLYNSMNKLGVPHRFVSFSRQYPALLYPGKSDKDPSKIGQSLPGVRYDIDSMNPLSWWRSARRIAASKPALVAFHWWTIFWAPCFIVMCYLLRRSGIQVAFICHNLEDHDAGRFKSALSRRLLGMADGFLTHSQSQKAALESLFPGKRVLRHPIPSYGHYPAPTGSLQKRGRLELLFFGFIRPYKGLDLLLEALEKLQDPDVYLTVVGEPWGDMQAIEQAATRFGDRVELHLEYKADEEVADYFERADFVILPYRQATGSAVASVAHHYQKPLLASNVGGLPDVVQADVTGILFPPNDVSALTQVLADAGREQALRLSANVRDHGQQWTWETLARHLQQLATRPDAAPRPNEEVHRG